VRARGERLPRFAGVAVLVTAAAAVCWVIGGITGSGDYHPGGAVLGDNAAPAIAALIHGHLAGAAASQPLMGLVSLVWRAPFTAAGVALGGDGLAYRLGALACVMPVLAATWWLAGRVWSLPHVAAAVAATALMAAGPITAAALQLGHPEEVLTALLTAGAVICAGENRRWLAGILLGLAVASKPWALVAAPCVLLALPGRRLWTGAVTAAVAAPAVGLLPLLNPAAYRAAERLIGTVRFATPTSLWWPTAGRRLGLPDSPTRLLPLSLTRTGVTVIAFGLAAALIWAYAQRAQSAGWPYAQRAQSGRGVRRVDGLALLCLLALVRCLADPAPVDYYYAAVVIPLALWETGIRRQLPLLAVLVSVVVNWLPQDFAAAQQHGTLGLDLLNAVWLAGGAALAAYLARSAVGPAALGRATSARRGDRQDAGRAAGYRGNPSSGMSSQGAA
jgi:hypothetical protein